MQKTPPHRQQLVEQVRRLYRSSGLTQAELAAKLRISSTTMQSRLQGSTSFTVEEVWEMEEVFGVIFIKGTARKSQVVFRDLRKSDIR